MMGATLAARRAQPQLDLGPISDAPARGNNAPSNLPREVAMTMMTTTLAVVWMGAALAAPQEGQPAAEVTVEKSASPELVGQLVKELAITPAQAQGAAGTMFGA